jgi:hypothetical protein
VMPRGDTRKAPDGGLDARAGQHARGVLIGARRADLNGAASLPAAPPAAGQGRR